MVAKSSTMDRIQILIAKLKEQADQQADPAQMLVTLQLLQNELRGIQKTPKTLGTSKVAVVLPSSVNINYSHYEKYAPKPAEEPVIKEKEKVVIEDGNISIVQENGQLDMTFDPMTEIPTLSQQLNENVAKTKSEENGSLNDKLKQGKPELMEVLKESPIKDLRKAIGINDRFLFINDLFRGDESMYERSIRTINGLGNFAEAEYWINRELKVKLGWNPDDPTVLHFDQLIKRRFS